MAHQRPVLICCAIGVFSLNVSGYTSETAEGPTSGPQENLGEGTLSIGAIEYALAIDDCTLKSTFADGKGRLYPAIHGVTGGEPFVIALRLDETGPNERSATLLDFSTEKPWSWMTIDIDRGRDQTAFSVTVDGAPFSVTTGTDGKLVPQSGKLPIEAGTIRLEANTFARLDVGEPLEDIRLDITSACKVHWSF